MKIVHVSMNGISVEQSKDFSEKNIFKSSKSTKNQKTTSKKYSKIREQEMFEMILSGCVISDGKNYNQLK